MLKIYNPSDATDLIPFPIANDMRFVTHKYNGYDTLTFEISSNDELYRYIVEETKIEDEKNRYVVKTIDEHSDFVTVKCEIDLDDWKCGIFYEYRRTNATLAQILNEIIPDGWTVVWLHTNAARTTIEDTEGKPMLAVTPLEILDKASSTYSCVFNFDVLNKIITVVDPSAYTPSGQFFTDELNLKNLGYVGTSNNFATRLYAYGKKDENGVPLTVSDVNDGKPYIEDYSYSDKVICIGWSDERYTTAESLKAAAMAKLKLISFPSRSYTCDAQNLEEDVWLYKVVTLIDRRRKTRVDHQIVEFKEYPEHSLDTITLSKTTPNVESFISRVESDAQNKIAQEASSMQVLLQEAIDYATKQITGNKGGNFMWIFDSDNRPVELVNLTDSIDINEAKSVWRWNASGLGHSNDGYNGKMTMALLPNGSINASVITTGIMIANIIRAGILASVDEETFYLDLEKGILKMKATEFSIYGKTVDEIAQEKADAAEDNAVGQAVDIAQSAVDQQTQADIFNKLTNNGTLPGLYMKNGQLYINASYLASGIIDAAVVKVVNLIAEKLTSTLGNSTLSINGAQFTLSGLHGQTFGLYNWDDGVAYAYMEQYDANGNSLGRSQYGANRIYLGGTWANPALKAETGYNSDGSTWSQLTVDKVNPGKRTLFTGICDVGGSCTVPNTGNYDLFAVFIGDGSTQEETAIMCYKYGSTVRGIGGRANDLSSYKQLHFFEATISGNTWTLIDCGYHSVLGTGSISAGSRRQLMKVIGIL